METLGRHSAAEARSPALSSSEPPQPAAVATSTALSSAVVRRRNFDVTETSWAVDEVDSCQATRSRRRSRKSMSCDAGMATAA